MKENKSKTSISDLLKKAIELIMKMSKQKRQYLLQIFKKVEQVQKSNSDFEEKTLKIKTILWTEQPLNAKLFIGAFLGTIAGLVIFGTGGIGIAALGGAIGFWGFLAGTAGGTFIASLIHNFEKVEE
jgi:hypothetical protein